ncbi:MAG: carboxypeptidase regulatory-like domain-containing protein [Mariprofundaceae bacterium]|nr:carboxypeptidase regulatory-like domain-containing protein [Mariprofundaceae bacterium]
MLIKKYVQLCTLFILCLSSFTAFAIVPQVGSLLTNQAQSTFVDSYTQFHVRLSSNTVRTRITHSELMQLTTPQTIRQAAGYQFHLSHTLKNIGNAPSTYTFNVTNILGDNYDITGLMLIHDVNGNGLPDSGEPILNTGQTLTLGVGEQAKIIIQGTIPATLATTAKAWVDVTATTALGLSASNRDTIIVQDGAVLNLVKSENKTTAIAGDTVVYTLDLNNSGNATAQGIPITIDGYAATKVLIRDVIPANTRFAGFISTGGAGRGLYHVIGAPLHSYVTQPPLDLNAVDAMAVAFPSMIANSNLRVQFQVVLHANASGEILNHGVVYDVNPTDGLPYIVPSNEVRLTVPPSKTSQPAISYYTDATYTIPQASTVIGRPLYIEANASSCNADPLVAEQRTVVVKSALTSDLENLSFTETGANTGIFILSQNAQAGLPTRDANKFPVTQFNKIIETFIHDTLTATILGCAGASVNTKILIDPSGVVFDDVTNAPIAGATVTIYTGTNQVTQATVWNDPTMTIAAPSSVVTDAYGAYQFPFVAPGTYNIRVTPPVGSGYKPSLLNPSLLPLGRAIVGVAGNPPTGPSYNTGTFLVNAATGAVVIDFPLRKSTSVAPVSGLFVRKTVASPNVNMGEVAYYTVDINNTAAVAVNAVTMNDHLPHGFSYIAGSMKRDGVKVADPTLTGGNPSFTLALGTLAAGATTSLTYAARAGVGSLQGDGINSAWASTPFQTSNVAQAKVTVIPGMLGDQAYLFGKMYMDCDHNRMQGREEIGVPGVRLYMEDGTSVVTDVEGKWSLYGLSPRTHVVKVDSITLPKGAHLINLSNRHAGDPNSVFVDLKKGDFHRADFAISNCSQAIRAEVFQRRDQGAQYVSELQRSVRQQSPSTVVGIPSSGTRSPIAQGMLDPHQPLQGIELQGVPSGLNDSNSNVPKDPIQAVMQVPLDVRMRLLDNSFGFIDLHDGDVLPYRQSNVTIKGLMGSHFQLFLNGHKVSNKKVGEKSSLPSKNLEAWKYIALDMKPGKNTLRVMFKGPFGNVRGDQTIHIVAPGHAAKIDVQIPNSADADGHSKVTVLVKLLDKDGVPVTVRTPLTLESSLGRWFVKDVNPVESGTQTFIQGGQAEFKLLPPEKAGEAKIRISSGVMEQVSQLDFLPPLRPMVAVGVLEGRIQLNHFNMNNIKTVRQRDSFEQQLTLFANSNGKRDAAARAAVFLKGRVLGSYLLTAAYDSDKTVKKRLLRDIQPNQYYPIYGDSSVKRFEAQSTQRMYVRVDHGRSWLLYGDFTTQADAQDSRKLSKYNRTMTGVRNHLENKFLSVDGFAAQGSFRQKTQELLAKGTAGPYYLTAPNMLLNSEKISILTRDRNQPSVILKETVMQRFADYSIDAVSGRIIFAKPVPSLDSNLNPQSIRVLYEMDQGGKQFWTMGVNADVKLGEHVKVGGTYVKDQNPSNPSKLIGTHTTLKLSESISATAEIARSSSTQSGVGYARWAEVKGKHGKLDGRIYAGNSDVAFQNSSALLNQGREEAGVEVTAHITQKTSVKAKLLHTRDKNLQTQRRALDVSANHTLNNWVNVETGYRQSVDSTGAAAVRGALTGPNQSRSLRLKLAGQIPGMKALGVSGEYERDINTAGKRRIALGANYQLENQGKLYVRHELISSNSGAFGLNGAQSNSTTIIGLDTKYMKDGTIFSEYRARDAISGREDQAAMGLRNTWHVSKDWQLGSNIEHIVVLNGPSNANSSTVGASASFVGDPLLKATGRLEFHWGSTENSLLSTLGAAKKLDFDYSLLGKNTFTQRLTLATQKKRVENVLQVGLAYRQTHRNNLDALMMGEWGYRRDDALGMRRQSYLLSTHVNYQPIRPMTLSGRYGNKWIKERYAGMSLKYGLQALGARMMYDVTERVDVGVIGTALWSYGFSQKHYGLGIESGYLMQANLWASLGYNMFGYRDKEMVLNQYTDQGFFLRLRYKFDENILDSLSH